MPHVVVLLLSISTAWFTNGMDPEPRYLFRFNADGAIADSLRGIPVSTKALSVSWKLDDESAKLYPDLLRQKAEFFFEVSLARGSRRIGTIDWDTKMSITKPTNHLALGGLVGAQPGDRLLIEVKEINVRDKALQWHTLTRQKGELHQFGLY
ncbi:MAG: hypothetical protein EAZ91_09170 [Cytophagales bacterium]|nr:MAG: hypothetical protein EAZ91_09170 [Cytophagales bacterium]